MLFSAVFMTLALLWCGVCRELQEECGVTATSLEKVGVILFEFIDEPPIMEVHVFKTSEFLGDPTESEGLFLPNVL